MRDETHPWFMRRYKFTVLNEVEPVYNLNGFVWGGNQSKGGGDTKRDPFEFKKRPWYRARQDDGKMTDIYGNPAPESNPDKNTYTRYPIAAKYKHSYDGKWTLPFFPTGAEEWPNACRVLRPEWSTAEPQGSRFTQGNGGIGVGGGFNCVSYSEPFEPYSGQLVVKCRNHASSCFATKYISRTAINNTHNPQIGVSIGILCTYVEKTWLRSYREETRYDIYGQPFKWVIADMPWYRSPNVPPSDGDTGNMDGSRDVVTLDTFMLVGSVLRSFTAYVNYTQADNPYPNHRLETQESILNISTKQWVTAAAWASNSLDQMVIEWFSPKYDKVITREPTFRIVSVETGTNY